MPSQDTTRRLSPQIVNRDVDALHGLRTVPQYDTVRPEASLDALHLAYQNMLAQQQVETERQLLSKAAADAARLAEWDFLDTPTAKASGILGSSKPLKLESLRHLAQRWDSPQALIWVCPTLLHCCKSCLD